jgi:hypothetical protein
MEALAKYAGYGSLEERSAGLNVAFEERISHAWETYLLEGKAPAAALAPVFARFKVWLTNIYEGVAGIARQYAANHDGELIVSDEARGIFDRWLASGHEVDAAKRAQEAQPFPVEHLKLDEKGTAAYAKALAEERQAAEATVLQHLAEAGKGAAKDFVIEERARIEGEVSKELDASPVQRLRTYLLEGHDPGAGTTLEGKSIAEVRAVQAVVFPDGVRAKLSREEIVARYGEAFAESLPKGSLTGGKNVIAADTLAEVLGFSSGDEMLRAVAKAEPREVVLERETQRRLQEAFPELLGEDAAGVSAAAAAAVHGDAAVTRAILEARWLRRQIDPTTDPRAPLADAATFKAVAAQLVAEKRVGDLQPSYYLQAERSAAKKALEAAADGGRSPRPTTRRRRSSWRCTCGALLATPRSRRTPTSPSCGASPRTPSAPRWGAPSRPTGRSRTSSGSTRCSPISSSRRAPAEPTSPRASALRPGSPRRPRPGATSSSPTASSPSSTNSSTGRS